jgi:hypothetical protein
VPKNWTMIFIDRIEKLILCHNQGLILHGTNNTKNGVQVVEW